MAKYKKRADGRYQANIKIGVNPNGKIKYKTLYAKSEAELKRKIAEVTVQLNTGTYADDNGVKFEEWANKWIDIYKTDVAEATRQSYRYAMKQMGPINGIRLKQLKKSDIQMLLNEKNDNPDTQRLVRLTINQILESAIDEGLIFKNVCRGIRIQKKKTSSSKRSLTDKEKEAIKKCDFTLKEKAFVELLYYTGIRKEEVCALTIKDIDFEKKEIDINKAITWKVHPSQVKECKSRSSYRRIPINECLIETLEEYISTIHTDYLFCMDTGKILSDTGYKTLWGNIYDKINCTMGGTRHKTSHRKIIERGITATDISAHMFRHNYATMLYYAGVDIKEAQRLLGHANITITLEIYTHLESNKDALHEKINSLSL